jgi:hypothetical protein
VTKGSLVRALNKLSCFSVIQRSCSGAVNTTFEIAGTRAGTFGKPKVDLILRHAIASSFGRGNQTVMDPAYRSGREILAANIDIERSCHLYLDQIKRAISATMFVGREIRTKLYKMAIYTEGGHFDWHMDTTHSENHHATLLLALNNTWGGGDLVLRQNGVEIRPDMHPKTKGSETLLQWVAFYTDTEHKVEPLSSGVRIVLQYDVEVVGLARAEDEDSDMDTGEDPLNDVQDLHIIAKKTRKHSQFIVNEAALKEVIGIITKRLQVGEESIGFALQHLSHKSCILPEFLKGMDALLYSALVESFDVSLHPVILCGETNDDGDWEPFTARIAQNDASTVSFNSSDEDVSESEDSDSSGDTDKSMDIDGDELPFHVPSTSAIVMISRQHYTEHLGNEPQPGESKYFGSGMFVRERLT